MSGSYIFIAGILLYLFLLRTLDSPRVNPLKTAVVWASSYYVLVSIVLAIEYTSKDIPVLPNLLDPMRFFVALMQLVAAAAIFYKVEQTDDDFMSYVFWGGVGLALIFFIVPALVQQLFTMVF